VAILQLNPEIARRQDLNHAALEFYVFFSSHRRQGRNSLVSLSAEKTLCGPGDGGGFGPCSRRK
jgi:hypothetical protein